MEDLDEEEDLKSFESIRQRVSRSIAYIQQNLSNIDKTDLSYSDNDSLVQRIVGDLRVLFTLFKTTLQARDKENALLLGELLKLFKQNLEDVVNAYNFYAEKLHIQQIKIDW